MKISLQGQPNAITGTCDEDVMIINNSRTAFELCGWNSGQHGENYRMLVPLITFTVIALRAESIVKISLCLREPYFARGIIISSSNLK